MNDSSWCEDGGEMEYGVVKCSLILPSACDSSGETDCGKAGASLLNMSCWNEGEGVKGRWVCDIDRCGTGSFSQMFS